MEKTCRTLLIVSLAALAGCATQGLLPNRQVSALAEPTGAKQPAPELSPSALVEFMQSLSRHSSSNGADFEAAFVQILNKDADGLGLAPIRSAEDIRLLSASDQLQLLKRLAADPAMKDALSLSTDDSVANARSEALATQNVRQATTSGVADLRSMGATSTEGMISQNSEIQRLTGVSVLGERCNALTDSNAVQNLRAIVGETHADVVAGKVKQSSELASDLDEHISETEGTNRGVAHNRRCRLAQPKADQGSCAVFSGAMYVGCDD